MYKRQRAKLLAGKPRCRMKRTCQSPNRNHVRWQASSHAGFPRIWALLVELRHGKGRAWNRLRQSLTFRIAPKWFTRPRFLWQFGHAYWRQRRVLYEGGAIATARVLGIERRVWWRLGTRVIWTCRNGRYELWSALLLTGRGVEVLLYLRRLVVWLFGSVLNLKVAPPSHNSWQLSSLHLSLDPHGPPCCKNKKRRAAKFSILYYLSVVISWKEKLAFDLSKISAVKFSTLYYLSLVISWKEKLAFDSR